jgi:hypothetical protein
MIQQTYSDRQLDATARKTYYDIMRVFERHFLKDGFEVSREALVGLSAAANGASAMFEPGDKAPPAFNDDIIDELARRVFVAANDAVSAIIAGDLSGIIQKGFTLEALGCVIDAASCGIKENEEEYTIGDND